MNKVYICFVINDLKSVDTEYAKMGVDEKASYCEMLANDFEHSNFLNMEKGLYECIELFLKSRM